MVEEIDAADVVAHLIEIVGGDGGAGGLVGQRQLHLGVAHDRDLPVGDEHGVLRGAAGLVDAVLDDDAQGHAGGGGEEVGVDGPQDVVTLLLGVGHRPVDGGGAVDGARALQQDGLHIAVRLQLQGVALDPAAAVDGDGVVVGQTVHDPGGGLELFLPGGGVHRVDGQEDSQHKGGHPAKQSGRWVFHRRSFVICKPAESSPL